jgi:catechol 2,3-dioxygenase-like lactoylglutathione lyase family enzyme
MKMGGVAGFGPIVRDVGSSRAFWGAALGIELEEAAPDYWTSGDLGGVRAFTLWRLDEAADLCFGSGPWPEELPEPQAWIALDVESPEAVAETAAELAADGHRVLQAPREDEWGQTTARLLSPEGVLTGVTYAPVLPEGRER